MSDVDKFYLGQRWCSHDDGKTFHREHWTCHLRAAILREFLPHPEMYVSAVDHENGTITISTRAK
jgi:hypothetical protein